MWLVRLLPSNGNDVQFMRGVYIMCVSECTVLTEGGGGGVPEQLLLPGPLALTVHKHTHHCGANKHAEWVNPGQGHLHCTLSLSSYHYGNHYHGNTTEATLLLNYHGNTTTNAGQLSLSAYGYAHGKHYHGNTTSKLPWQCYY